MTDDRRWIIREKPRSINLDIPPRRTEGGDFGRVAARSGYI